MANLCSRLPCFKASVLPWIILFLAATNVIFLGGKRRAFGSFIAELHKGFGNITLTELNWIGDSYSALGNLSTFVSTILILHFNRRYALFETIGSLLILLSCVTSAVVPNPHWLFLTHTVFHGIGSSLVLSIAGLLISEYFDKNHPYHLWASTMVCGGPLASILFVSLFAYVIQVYKWRMAFIVLGAIYFVIIGSSAIFFRRNESLDENKSKSFNFHFGSIGCLQLSTVILWFCDRIITSVVTFGLLMNLTDYLYRMNPNLVNSTILTSIFAIGEGLSFLTTSIITASTKTFFENKIGYIIIGTSLVASLCLIGIEFTNHLMILQRLLCFLIGYSIGFSNTLFYPAGEELTKLPGPLAYTLSLGGSGAGLLMSPLLSAKIAEIFTYKWFFLVQGSLVFCKVICISLIKIIRFPSEKSNNVEEEIEKEHEIENESPNETSELLQKQKENNS